MKKKAARTSPARRRNRPSAKDGSDSAARIIAAKKSGLPVLILMQKGEEKTLAAAALARAGIRLEICARLDQLAKQINDQTGAVLLAEEALTGARISQLAKTLRAQPQWSDLPLLVLTSGDAADDARQRDLFGANANVTFLTRPLRVLTLVSAVEAALRARRHQFALRDLLRERETFLASNITERKKQERLAHEREARLKESQNRLRLATEAADIGTFDFFPKTGELQFSERSRELFGVPPGAKVTYEMYLAGVHPDDRHIVHETVERVKQPGNTGRFDIEYRTVGICDGRERWVAERGRAVLDSSGEVTRFIGTLLDITDSKNAEMLLESSKNAAEEANRAKDKFLAMLSHELRTPLTPVLMTIAALRRQPELSEDMRHDLEMLQRNVELEALLIDDLLDLTRITHGKLELRSDALDIHSALDQALSISGGDLAGKNINVTRRFEAREHHSWADPARLQQVFWNLVKNAAKFTPRGGRVSVATRNDEAHHVVIEISDNGIGIEPELMPRIFDAFEQGGRSVTSKYGGLGLGLAISKRVVDLHQGSLTARSAGAGEGATFIVTLKAMETSLLEGPVLFLESEPSVTRLIQILFVEDHEDTARALSRLLMNAGYAVSHANSLARAHELVAGQRFDLVISDLGLPDGSGLDLMRRLRETWSLSGIALSGFGTDDDVAASSAAGFAEHITKPVDWERLRSAIERLTPAKDSAERSAA